MEGDSAQHATLLEALPVAQSMGDEVLITEVLRSLGCSAPTLEECRRYLADALARSTSLGLLTTRCTALSSLGSVLWGWDMSQKPWSCTKNSSISPGAMRW